MKTINNDLAQLNFVKKSELYILPIKDMKFHPIQKNDFHIKELLLVGINGSFLPSPITLLQNVIISGVELMYTDCLIRTKNKGNGTTSILIKASYFVTEYDATIEQETLYRIKKGLILNQKKLTPKTLLYGFTDGVGHLHYSITVPSEEIQNLTVQAKFSNTDLDKQIHNMFPNNSLLMQNAMNYSPMAKIA
jgi:hypothetical protein